MEYTKEQEKSTVIIKFVSNEQEYSDAVSKAYQKTKGQYNIPGFRKGKAPRHMIEKMYGASVFADDAVDIIINESYMNFLDENADIEPVDRPEVDINEFDGVSLKFTVKVQVRPEVKFGKYKGIKLPKIEYNATDEQVDEEIGRALERNARFVEADRPAQSGDVVNIDYSGSVDGVKFEGGTAEKYDLTLGSNTFIPGFEEQLIGRAKGEEADVKVVFPEEYHAENLKGKEAVFACRINSVTVKELPEADDKWASEVSEYETLAEYKNSIKERLQAECDRRARTESENAVINAVVDGAECDVPEAMIRSYLDDMLRDIEMRLSYQGLKIDDYFKYTGTSVEQFKTEKREEAKRGALTRLCLEELLKLENVEVTDGEAEEKYHADFPKMKEGGKKPDARELAYVKNELAMEKLLSILIGFTEWTEAEDVKPAAKKSAPKSRSKKTENADA